MSASRPAAAPSLPPLERLALFLDLDGTLLEIAPKPDAVTVPASLPALLANLDDCLGGALALVSGRTVASVLGLFPDTRFVVAGEHGAQLRLPDGAIETRALPSLPAAWRKSLAALAAGHPGVLLEEKPHGAVLHYRGAPAAKQPLEAAVQALVAPEANFVILPARMAWEIRPRGIDKGSVVRALLGRPPFAGRLPVFVGDDTTDLDGIRAARAAGGFGFEVAASFGDPRGVRAWLAALLDGSRPAGQGA